MREGHEEADPKRLDSKGLSSADPKRVNSKGMSSAWKKKQYELTDLVCRGQNIDWTAVLFYTNYGGLDPNHVDKVQMTTLHHAAFAGQPLVLQWCIQAKGDVDARTVLGRTPLHYACDADQAECVRMLLGHKADVNLANLSCATPLHVACANDSLQAAAALFQEAVSCEVDVNAEDSRRQTPEMLTKNKELLKLISDYRDGADFRRKCSMMAWAAMAFASDAQLGLCFGAWAKEACDSKAA
ncbi:unnamed protein product [Polarella glacialis]|uniref:Uncharacterized protein n=1 Tax=Polarella glacialis TaxID=89957 RepID=A0A813DK83_POLGL|nr:unnamed protein product [Polarella glacialis]